MIRTRRGAPDPDSPVHRRGPWRLVLALAVLLLFIGGGVLTGIYWFSKRQLAPSGGMYFFSRVELTVPLFQQADPVWGHDRLALSTHTLGQVGCAVSSAAMIMKYYGLDTDPGRLNNFLRDHGGYNEDNDLIWEGPPQLAPDKVRHVYEDLPSYYLIDSNLYRGNPVIVRMRFANGITHFVVVMGKQGFDYLIRDPSHYGLEKGVYPLKEICNNIEALRYYEKAALR